MKQIHNPLKGVKRGVRMLTGLALALMLFIQAAGAAENTGAKVSVDPVNHSENYSAVLYNNRNGLPSSDANTIAQTSEGFIWIGSYSGLIRYDGSTFERLDSTNGMGSIVELFVDSRDRLWIGTNDNGLALWEDGEFTIWNDEAQLGSTKISTIEEDADGTIYIGTTMGITAISPDLTLRHLDDPRIANIYMEHITRGEDGLLYCITNEDDIFTLRNGELVEFTDHSSTKIQGVTFIRPDPSDPLKLYVGTEDSRFYRISTDFDLRSLEYINIEPLNSVNDIVKIGDSIWICARNGIGELDDKGFHNLDNLPMNNSVNKMMVDYEGNLWFTSSRQGVMKLVSNKFTDIFVRYGLEPDVVNATCMYKGHLFIGTDTGAKVLNNDRQVYTIPLSEARTASGTDLGFRDLLKLLDGCRIRSITPDSHGRLWISTWRACGLLRYDGGRVTAFTESDGLHSNQVRAVSEMADGSMIVANTGGVSVIKGDEVVLSVGVDDGIANPETLSVCAAPNGDILLGSNGGGIYVVNDGGVRCIGREDGLTSEIIMRIKHDPMNNVFWLVTSNSIAYMTEDYKVATVKEFPYSNNFDLYINKKGDMWILSSNGIYVVSSAEMIANGRINPVHYGLGNGLPCTATSNSYSALTPQGDLYISGSSGVAKVNIEAALEDITDLKQAVPYIEADGKLLYPDENGGFTLSPDVKKVTIYGYVFNYSLTDPQVSYILEGFDREPVTLSRSDLGPVTYTNLHGGDYRFVMVLTDALGRGENKLSVPIVKEKALHEKPWFYVLLGVGAAALIALLVHAYTRRKMHILEEKHREEKEKERITNELHMANRIQGSMLPHDFPPFPDRKEFDIYADMDPAREVGGDFYDFFLIDDDHLCVVMADVSGKGIPAALYMMVSKVILQSYATMGQSAAEILTKTNDALCSSNQTDMFVTVWLGILEISTGKIIAANAGHEYPVIRKADGPFELLKDKHGFVIGGMGGMKYKEYEIQLSPGDRLFLYTDGLPEATDAENNMFGTERMIESLNEGDDTSPRAVLDTIRKAVDGFVKDAEQFDDLTMLCLEYYGPEGAPEGEDK